MQKISSKIRRALRNGTGVAFSFSQLTELHKRGIVEQILILGDQDLCRAATAPTESVIIGSTKDETASRPKSGKSLAPPNDRSYIAALTARV